MKTTGKRLEALEQAAQAERARVEALQDRQLEHAIRALSDDDLRSLRDWYQIWEQSPEEAQRVRNSVRAISVCLDQHMADQWEKWANEVDGGSGPFPLPPDGLIPYLHAEADDWKRAEHAEASATPDMQRAARWNAAQFMYYAGVAEAVSRWPR